MQPSPRPSGLRAPGDRAAAPPRKLAPTIVLAAAQQGEHPLDDSWFDHRRPRTAARAPVEAAIDPLADAWFR